MMLRSATSHSNRKYLVAAAPLTAIVCHGGKRLYSSVECESGKDQKQKPITVPTRSEQLKRLSSKEFDVLIVGGGATGCGASLDAASRGLSTALIERGDFGTETSARSTKLLWVSCSHFYYHTVFSYAGCVSISKMCCMHIRPTLNLTFLYQIGRHSLYCHSHCRASSFPKPHASI